MDSHFREQTELVRKRFAEVCTWCFTRPATTLLSQGFHQSYHFNIPVANLSDHLRSPELRPVEATKPDIDMYNLWESLPERQQKVEQLASIRATLLQAQPLSVDVTDEFVQYVAGGRFLLYDPDGNLSDGAAANATSGFFDNCNVPPWDTWVYYFVGNSVITGTTHKAVSISDSYLLSWVPPELVEIADNGIEVNPEQCIAWAKEVDALFIYELQRVGIIL